MKAYVHQGNGHWIGSHVVVIAAGPLEAVEMIRGQLDASGLQREPVTIQGLREFPLNVPGVVLMVDGDY